MEFSETKISGVYVIEPAYREDDRGRFFRAWCAVEFADNDIHFLPVQASMGFSHHKGTLRGMHFQADSAAEAKLVRCTRGAIFDVALDLRSDSPTFRQWHGEVLTATNGRMLYLPEGCAHGYQTLEEGTEMHYMTSHVYVPSSARGVRFDDPAFCIRWPLPTTVISEQDRSWPLLG